MKKLDKLLSVILALVLTLSIIPVSSVTANAANVPEFKLMPSRAAAQVGDVISVDIAVTENSKLCGVVLDVIYDPSEFEVVEVTSKHIFDVDMLNPTYSDHAVRFVGTATTHIGDEEATLFTVKFKVLKNCCDLYVLLKEAYIINEKGQSEDVTLDANFISRTIKIHESSNENLYFAPTCVETGYKTYNCPCGEFVEEFTPATGHNYENRVCTVCGEVAPNEEITSLVIREPSRTAIRSKDGIVLRATVKGDITGTTLIWSASNDNFKTEASGNDLTIISDKNGYTTFTASVYDSDGKLLASSSIEMQSKANFFQRIGGFFRDLFGLDKIYEY